MPSMHAELIEMLLTRLERVPADSFWAHRASGVRGSLLGALEREEAGKPLDSAILNYLTREAIRILERAAARRVSWGPADPGCAGPAPVSGQPDDWDAA
jgi:hypothetical protein